MSASRVEIAILGGGVVGLACAFALADAGREVALFDPSPGRGASFGNAGGITPGWVAPVAMPATLRALPRMLLDSASPLTIRPAYLPQLLPWLWHFVWAARPHRVEAISKALAALTLDACDIWAAFAGRAGLAHLLRRQGLLYVYAKQTSRDGAEPAHALRRKRGVRLEEVDRAWLQNFAPMLAPEYRFGVFAPDAGHVVDPGALCDGLAASFEAKGGRIVRARIDRIAPEANGVAFSTQGGDWRCDKFVLAAGAHSKPFAAALGAKVPLDVERGYHAMLPRPGLELPAQLIDGEGKYAVTSMAGGLRLAGTVELAGLDLPPDYRRAEQLIASAKRLMPALDASDPSLWMGFRPSLPDGLPVLGPAPATSRAVFAFGHAHLGVTLAAKTASIVADLVAGKTPPIDLSPFSPLRYA
ncbi:MAG: FAD-dependent oxidoreductase [Magnetospirillum sp.]|nr:FAD-dependent oxidoreductase [Magnetospirillum sp.]